MTYCATQADPALVFADERFLYFGLHGATDPVYEGAGWFDPYDRRTTGRPPWRGDVLRCAWSGALLLPDWQVARAGRWERLLWAIGLRERPAVHSPVEVNAQGLPWLQSSPAVGVRLTGGMPLSRAAEEVAKMGAELYVPLTTTGAAGWRWLDEVRRGCLRVGQVADETEAG